MSHAATDSRIRGPKGEAVYWRVISYLRGNPHEELTRHDVAVKFGVAPTEVDTLLMPAVSAKQLVRADSDDDGAVWRLPPHKGHFPRAKAPVRRSAVKIDFSAIIIEKGIPMPEPEKRGNVWKPILSQMEPGDSFQLPIEARDAVAHATQAFRRLMPGSTFAVRKINSTVRVWRLT